MKQNYSELPNGYLETIQNGIAGVRTFRSGITRGTGTRQENLERLKEEIGTADAIVIGAGAGLSTAAGFIYTGERFEKWFSISSGPMGYGTCTPAGSIPIRRRRSSGPAGPGISTSTGIWIIRSRPMNSCCPW